MDEHHVYVGYTIRDGKIIIKKDEAVIIKRIFDYAKEGKSANQIARILNRENVRTFYNAKAWYHTRILQIIRNQEYTGTGMYPKIIKSSDFQKANSNIIDKIPKLRINHPLVGFIKCESCYYLYHPYKNRYNHSKIEWYCNTRKNKGKSYCSSYVIPNDKLENAIDRAFKKLIDNPRIIEIYPKVSNYRHLTEIRNLKSKLENGIENKKDINYLLDIAQQKAQLEYDDSLVENHMLLYQTVYKIISKMRNKDMMDYKMISAILKEIVIDSENNKIYIELINNQVIETSINN